MEWTSRSLGLPPLPPKKGAKSLQRPSGCILTSYNTAPAPIRQSASLPPPVEIEHGETQFFRRRSDQVRNDRNARVPHSAS